jgi:very-short-patch-repair endonuclease
MTDFPELEVRFPELQEEPVAEHESVFGEGPSNSFGEIAARIVAEAEKIHIEVQAGICESPIEIILAANMALDPFFARSGWQIIRQFRMDGYRYDFAIQREGANFPTLFIECDGREFHSAPEQRANDRRKDAAVRARGCTILRFTGSQIDRYPAWCVDEIKRVLGVR